MIRVKTNIEEAMSELIEMRWVCVAWNRVEVWENYVQSQDLIAVNGGAIYGNCDGKFYYI